MKYDCPDILKNKRLIVLDLETSGLSIKYNFIIELGIIEIINGKVKTSYSKMFGGGHSSMYLVRKVHKIRDCERFGKKTFKQCSEKISEFLSNSTIVTHNGEKFDLPMIQNKLNQSGYSIQNFNSIDTYQIAKKIGTFESNSLKNLCKHFDLEYGGEFGNKSHRGLEDSEATLQLLYCLIDKYHLKF